MVRQANPSVMTGLKLSLTIYDVVPSITYGRDDVINGEAEPESSPLIGFARCSVTRW